MVVVMLLQKRKRYMADQNTEGILDSCWLRETQPLIVAKGGMKKTTTKAREIQNSC